MVGCCEYRTEPSDSKSSPNFLTNKGTVGFSRPLLIDLSQGSHSAPISGNILVSTLSF